MYIMLKNSRLLTAFSKIIRHQVVGADFHLTVMISMYVACQLKAIRGIMEGVWRFLDVTRINVKLQIAYLAET